jgi:hypothetical protein
MIRRYDLRRSDNYLYTGRVSYVCSGSGTLFVYTGFPVTRATVGWVVYPFAQDEEMSSSSESSSSSTEIRSSSSSSSSESSSSSSTELMSSSSFSSISAVSSSSSTDLMSSSSLSSESTEVMSTSSNTSSSTSSSQTEVISGLPRLYVYSYSATGFTVVYENIPSQVGYIEFSFNAV